MKGKRTCLWCSKVFASRDAGHRKCPDCVGKKKEDREPRTVAMDHGIVHGGRVIHKKLSES